MWRSIVLFLMMVAASDAQAGPDVYKKTSIDFRYNPVGLQARSSLYAYKRHDDVRTSIGPTIAASPADIRGGLEGWLELHRVLRLTARWEGIGYFGTFNQLLSWPATEVPLDNGSDPSVCKSNPRACGPVDYSDRAMQKRVADGQNYTTRGWQGMGQARFVAAGDKVALWNRLNAYYTTLDLEDGDETFYDLTFDILMANAAWTLVNDADLLIHGSDDFAIGVRHSAVHAMHGDGSDADQWTQRVGPIIRLQPDGSWPDIDLLSQWWLSHSYRAGTESDQSVPQVLVRLTFYDRALDRDDD